MEGNCERDSSPVGKFPSAVTTLYHARNSNVFKSSESSVQITSAVNGHAYGGSSRTSQNFCELDIVSRREKEKVGDSFTDASRNTPFNSPVKSGVFRKTLHDRHVKETRSGILCLANLVKDVDEDYCKPIISKTREREEKTRLPVAITGDYSDPRQKQLDDFFRSKEYGESKKSREDGRGEMETLRQHMDLRRLKKSRSVSRKRRAKECSPTSRSVDRKPPNQVPNETKVFAQESLDQLSFDPQTESSKKVSMKFVDLAQARAMYFVTLPNQSTLNKKGAKSKHKKDNDTTNNPKFVEKEDPRLGHIIINKIDGEFPTVTSLDTESSVPIKLRSEVSSDSLIVIKKKQKKHNNSPQHEDSSRMSKVNRELKAKGKHKKKHRPSPRDSFVNDSVMNCDFVPCKEERRSEKEVEVLYKKRAEKKRSSSNMARSPSKRTDVEHKSNKHSSKSPVKEGKSHYKKDKSPIKEKTVKEKPKREKLTKQENKDDKKRRPRHARSENRDDKGDNKREISPKNLKMKDASHTMSKKISLTRAKGYDQKFKKGTTPNQTKRDPADTSKRRRENMQSILKRSPGLKEVRGSKDSRATNEPKSVSYELKNFQHEARSNEREERPISHQPMIMLTETVHGSTTKKQRNDVHEEKMLDNKGIMNIFLSGNKMKSQSCLMVPEQEIKDHFAALIYNKPKLIERSCSKSGKSKIAVKTVSSHDWSTSLRKKHAKKKVKSKLNMAKIQRVPSKCKDINEMQPVNDPTETIDEPSLVNTDIRPLPGEKSLQTSMQPLLTKSQCVRVGMPVNHYMGYFVPPQVAERFSRKYSTPHSVVPELLKPPDKNQEKLAVDAHPKIKRSRSCVPAKLTDNIVGDPDILSPSKSQILSSKRSSDTNVSRKMRSKSVVTRDHPTEIDRSTLETIESRERLRQELKKLGVVQQCDIRKRLKVISKPIERNDYEILNHSPGSEPIKGATGSNRLKPRLPSKEEQEAILSLPIFQNETMSSTNSLTSSELSAGIKVNAVLKLQSHYSQNPEEEPCHSDDRKQFRKGRLEEKVRRTARKEVSFSQLNTKPIPELYGSPRSDKLDFIEMVAADDKKGASKSTIYLDLISEPTDASFDYRENERKLQCVHMILGEKVTEIYNKATGNDGKVIEGYTVSGIEPPKKLKCCGRSSSETKYLRNTDKLHLMFCPPTQILNYEMQPKESYSYGIFMQPELVKDSKNISEQSDKSTLSSGSVNKSSKRNSKSDSTKTPIQVKTKRKLLPFETTKKRNKGLNTKKMCELKLFKKSEGTDTGKSLSSKIGKSLSSLFLDVSSSDDKVQTTAESSCKKQQKKLSAPRQEIRSLSRINSAVKMMESSLQIIKEESQSTDSSTKKVSDKKKKTSITDIKQTQTELATNDLDKMKEVISYLYMAFDRKDLRSMVDCSQDPRDIVTKLDIKQDNHTSSTESSSCCEQFKNMVKNVKPKFSTLKRISKPELSQRSSVVNRCSTSEGGMNTMVTSPSKMYRGEHSAIAVPDTCAFMCMNLNDSSSSLTPAERLCCSSDTKFFRQVGTDLLPPKNRPSSAEYVRPFFASSYSATKELLNNIRTTKSIHIEPEKQDKGICTDPKPEIKSSTSISDFSSVVVSVDDMEKERLRQEVAEIHTTTLPKTSKEKSIQCVLTENVNYKSESSVSSRNSRDNNTKTKSRKSNLVCILSQEESLKLNVHAEDRNVVRGEKMFENKSLQTSSGVADPKLVAKLERALPQISCNFVYPRKDDVRNSPFCNLDRKVSSQSFENQHDRKVDSGSSQDSLTATKTSVKFYKGKKDQDKSLHLSRHDKSHKSEGRKMHGKKTVEVDYINLLKLERHLEQVLGLYPTVCKAIRAHMASNLGPTKTADKCGFKDRRKIFFTSQDTLATTVDTITEYNVMETDENGSKSSQSKGHRNVKFPLNKYLYENRFKFPKPVQGPRKNSSRCSIFASSGNGSLKNVEVIEPSTPYPYTDSSSSSSRAKEYKAIQYKKERRGSKWNLRKGKKYKKGRFDFYNNIFSDNVKDNWSVGSPLYSISTPSLTFSKNDLIVKTKSKSLTTTQVLTSRLSTSKSLIEISSNKTINRRAIIRHIKEDLLHGGKTKTFRLGSQQVFVLSLDSKPLPTTSSKHLVKAEHHLQHQDQSEYTTSKLTELSEPKIKVDETNYYNLLFAENERMDRKDKNNAKIVNHPFYIHSRQSSSSDMNFLDSIEKPREKTEEDVGNFSADSLESTSTPADAAFNYTMELLQNSLVPQNQNFFVYTSTVNYGTNPISKSTKNERTIGSRQNSRPSSRHSSGRSSRKSTFSKPNSGRSCSLKRFLSPGSKTESPHRQSQTYINTKTNTVSQTGSPIHKSSEDSSNTLISESGYETSNRTKHTASIKSFFKKGGSLLDIFRHTVKSKAACQQDAARETFSGTNLTSFSTLYSKNHGNNQPDISTASTGRPLQDDDQGTTISGAKIFWSNLAQNKQAEKIKITFAGATHTYPAESHDKTTSTTANKKCSVSSGKSYEKQMCACHEYAEKVVQESQMRKEGFQKQYKDYEEIPLELLIGRKVPLAFRKGPIIQMNVATKKEPNLTESPRYPYYESDNGLQEKQPCVTFLDDKIVFKSSRTTIRKSGFRSKPTSPSRTHQEIEPLKQRGSIHDICYRTKVISKSEKQDDADSDSENTKRKSKRKKSQSDDNKDFHNFRKKPTDKGATTDRLALFRRKRSKSSVTCLCDSEDESMDTTATIPIESRSRTSQKIEDEFPGEAKSGRRFVRKFNSRKSEQAEDEFQTDGESEYQPSEREHIKMSSRKSRRDGRHVPRSEKNEDEFQAEGESGYQSPKRKSQTGSTKFIFLGKKSCFRPEFKTRGTEPFFPCLKKKRTAETQMEETSKSKATETTPDLPKAMEDTRTKETHMEVKPWHQTKGTEPMPADRISTRAEETQIPTGRTEMHPLTPYSSAMENVTPHPALHPSTMETSIKQFSIMQSSTMQPSKMQRQIIQPPPLYPTHTMLTDPSEQQLSVINPLTEGTSVQSRQKRQTIRYPLRVSIPTVVSQPMQDIQQARISVAPSQHVEEALKRRMEKEYPTMQPLLIKPSDTHPPSLRTFPLDPEEISDKLVQTQQYVGLQPVRRENVPMQTKGIAMEMHPWKTAHEQETQFNKKKKASRGVETSQSKARMERKVIGAESGLSEMKRQSWMIPIERELDLKALRYLAETLQAESEPGRRFKMDNGTGSNMLIFARKDDSPEMLSKFITQVPQGSISAPEIPYTEIPSNEKVTQTQDSESENLLQKDPSRTVHTQMKQDPILESLYKLDNKARMIPDTAKNGKGSPEVPIETIFESQTAKRPEPESQVHLSVSQGVIPMPLNKMLLPKKSILRTTSKVDTDRSSKSSQLRNKAPSFHYIPKPSKDIAAGVKQKGQRKPMQGKTQEKEVMQIKLLSRRSTIMLKSNTEGDVFLIPQEELQDDDVPPSVVQSDVNMRAKKWLNGDKVIDSLIVLHKVYEHAKTTKGQKVEEDKTEARARPTSVMIVEKPTIYERKDDSVESLKAESITDKPDEITHESDQSVDTKMEVSTTHSCASFVEKVMDEIIQSVIDESTLKHKTKEVPKEETNTMDVEVMSFEENRSLLDEELPHPTQADVKRQSTPDVRKGLTDKEVFDKLLTSFEKEDEIAVRLSKDDTFFQTEISHLKKDSEEVLGYDTLEKPKEAGALTADETVWEKHRSTHFWEEKMKAMKAKEENPVKTDDIGTCFARGFRPDNIALSGDACFNINKQDKIKFSKGMLTDEESIIDFSERETPLDYLLALGFMVDEASNALKDDDIRSRLLAAITEARVWINKITTTQGTLLYLVAYKSRPKTMRYFLQLVEAIINKRINNAIKLDGFLRILEKVEEGEIQMINILGADKFEDEENEEKIVKKQLRQLFITVYKIAEKEAQQKGNELSPQAIVLLRILAAKYRAGLHPHLELIARYIGQDLLNTETQLEAAMIFLSRLDTAEVKLKEFEAYCDIKCEKKPKQHSALKQHDAPVEETNLKKSASGLLSPQEDDPQRSDGDQSQQAGSSNQPQQAESLDQAQQPESSDQKLRQKNKSKKKLGSKSIDTFITSN